MIGYVTAMPVAFVPGSEQGATAKVNARRVGQVKDSMADEQQTR
jgi:hypothetical protein